MSPHFLILRTNKINEAQYFVLILCIHVCINIYNVRILKVEFLGLILRKKGSFLWTDVILTQHKVLKINF